jgi:ketosteroid isomerase-like protein
MDASPIEHASTDDGDELRWMEERLRAAMLAGDVAELDAMIDDALVFTTMTGAVVTKAMDLDAHRSRTLRISRMEPSEQRIDRYGDAAVVTVRIEMAGTFAETPFAGIYRYGRVWIRRPDGWRIVAGHVTEVRD